MRCSWSSLVAMTLAMHVDAEEGMEAQEIISQAVAAIGTNIDALAAAGAAIFLVANVPDLGVVPETRILAGLSGRPLLPEIATQRTEAFNAALEQEVVRLRDALGIGVNIALVNLFDANRLLLDNAAAYGLTNVDDPCFILVNETFVFDPACDKGANFDAFAFFDPIHPTAVCARADRTHLVCVRSSAAPASGISGIRRAGEGGPYPRCRFTLGRHIGDEVGLLDIRGESPVHGREHHAHNQDKFSGVRLGFKERFDLFFRVFPMAIRPTIKCRV